MRLFVAEPIGWCVLAGGLLKQAIRSGNPIRYPVGNNLFFIINPTK
jgi:hypothetical protein